MKIDKQLMQVIFSILIVGVLFVPAYASFEIEQRTETHIISLQGLYENGTIIHPYEPVDKTQVESLYTGEIKTGDELNNDSFYAKVSGVTYIHYTNFITYIGNGTYTVTPNYTFHTTPFTLRFIGVPLNITSHDLADFDFIRLTTNSDHTWHDIGYKTAFGVDYLFMDEFKNNTYIFINSLGSKAQLTSAPNEKMYLFFQDLDITDTTFNFKVEGFNLEPQDQLFWQSEHLIYGSVAVGLTLMIVASVFANNYIDVKYDKGNGRKKR